MLDSLVGYLAGLDPRWLYPALFLCAFLENIIPPLPGDAVVVFSGYLLARSDHNAPAFLAATTLGSAAGFMTYYSAGRLIHPDAIARKDWWFLPAAKIEIAEAWFRKHGYWIVLLNRFFSGIRAVISITAGMCRLPWLRVLALAALGCAVWNGLLIWGGYLLGENWPLISQFLTTYDISFLFLGLLLLGWWILRAKFSQGPK